MSYANDLSYAEDSSPGLDYQSLLGSSSSSSRSKFVKNSHIETEKIEDSVIPKLKAENLYLKEQIKIILKEKDMHIISNAKERLKIDKEVNLLRNSLESELLKLRKENQLLLAQNKDLLKRIGKNQSSQEGKVKFYKNQLEKLEKHYSVVINDKDRTISVLKNELSPKKTLKSKVNSRAGSSLHFQAVAKLSSKSKLDNISKLIVKLEKQQADLRESQFEKASEFDYNSLKEISERNKQLSHYNIFTERP